jgi:LmbE family N-acetylglucosaminyl deacetylase
VLDVELGLDPATPLTVLCMGAHSDDIEIGCGATVLQLARARPVRCHWVVLSADERRASEARAAARAFLEDCVDADVRVADFRESYFPYVGEQVKDYVQAVAAEIAPDLVLTHDRDDLHQDHRITGELCWNAFRDQLILEYEVPKYDGRHGSPNVFVPVEPWALSRKLELLGEHFGSQHGRGWYSDETFRGLLRLRGVEARAPSGYAEAFFGRKVVLAPGPTADDGRQPQPPEAASRS